MEMAESPSSKVSAVCAAPRSVTLFQQKMPLLSVDFIPAARSAPRPGVLQLEVLQAVMLQRGAFRAGETP